MKKEEILEVEPSPQKVKGGEIKEQEEMAKRAYPDPSGGAICQMPPSPASPKVIWCQLFKNTPRKI